MPKEAHTKAAEHHENAAKSHRTAAEHHGKGEHAKGSRENRRRPRTTRRPRTNIPRWRTARAKPRSKRETGEAATRSRRSRCPRFSSAMTDNSSAPDVPDHVDKAVRSVTQLHSRAPRQGYDAPASGEPDQPRSWAGPGFIVLVGLSRSAWIAANLMASRLGLEAIDPPPFPWLEAAASLVLALSRHARARRPKA